MNASVLSQPATPANAAKEQLLMLHGMSWEQYIALDAILGAEEGRLAHLAYLDGDLEIVSPMSRKHGHSQSRLGWLLQTYCVERHIECFTYGPASMQQEPKKAGLEPDESYCIGEEKDVPDLVLEAIVTSGGIDRLEAYRRYGVPEVWFWKDGRLTVYCLRRDGYGEQARSQLLPDLDLNLLARCVEIPSLLQAARIFREGLGA